MLGPSGKMRNDIATRFAITNEVFQLATDERTFHGGEATAPEMFERHLQPELGTMARKYASSFCGSKPARFSRRGDRKRQCVPTAESEDFTSPDSGAALIEERRHAFHARLPGSRATSRMN